MVYVPTIFSSRCICLLFLTLLFLYNPQPLALHRKKLQSSHSPSVTSAAVFGSPSKLLTAGQVPVDFVFTAYGRMLALNYL